MVKIKYFTQKDIKRVLSTKQPKKVRESAAKVLSMQKRGNRFIKAAKFTSLADLNEVKRKNLKEGRITKSLYNRIGGVKITTTDEKNRWIPVVKR